MFPMKKIANARQDELWSVREDLHTRFGDAVESHLIDALLDSVAAEFDREGGIGAFRKVLIEREVVSQLQRGADLSHFYADYSAAA